VAEIKMMTAEEAEAERQKRLAEVGTGPECPFCQKPRVLRSDYLRCNPCGVNWLMEEMHLPNYLNRNPSAARSEAARTTVGAARCSATPSMGDVDGKQ
jgi:hypothetical protein